MEAKIIDVLKELCIPMGNLGFRYIKTAVAAVLEDESLLDRMTVEGGLYDTVAKTYNTEKARVERCIRHAAETAIVAADQNTIEKYFGKVKGKVRNSDFIAGIAFAIKLQTIR